MRYFIILLIILGFGCSNNSNTKSNNTFDSLLCLDTVYIDYLPEIGDSVCESIRFSSDMELLVSSSDFSPSKIMECKGIIYTITWDNAGKVEFIVTTDTNFITSDSIKINMTLSDIKASQKIDVIKMPGWGYFALLESGWFIGFRVDETCTGRVLIDSDKVNFIFKR